MYTLEQEVSYILITIISCIFLIYLPVMYIQDNFDLILSIRYDYDTKINESSIITYLKFMLVFILPNRIIKYLNKFKKDWTYLEWNCLNITNKKQGVFIMKNNNDTMKRLANFINPVSKRDFNKAVLKENDKIRKSERSKGMSL